MQNQKFKNPWEYNRWEEEPVWAKMPPSSKRITGESRNQTQELAREPYNSTLTLVNLSITEAENFNFLLDTLKNEWSKSSITVQNILKNSIDDDTKVIDVYSFPLSPKTETRSRINHWARTLEQIWIDSNSYGMTIKGSGGYDVAFLSSELNDPDIRTTAKDNKALMVLDELKHVSSKLSKAEKGPDSAVDHYELYSGLSQEIENNTLIVSPGAQSVIKFKYTHYKEILINKNMLPSNE